MVIVKSFISLLRAYKSPLLIISHPNRSGRPSGLLSISGPVINISVVSEAAALIGNPCGRDLLRCRIRVNGLIVEEYLSAECLEYLFLLNSTEEKCLIKPDIPAAECLDDSFMGGSTSCGNKCSSNGTLVLSVFIPDPGKLLKKSRKGAFIKRIVSIDRFILLKRYQSLFLVDDLGSIVKEDRITVECYPYGSVGGPGI